MKSPDLSIRGFFHPLHSSAPVAAHRGPVSLGLRHSGHPRCARSFARPSLGTPKECGPCSGVARPSLRPLSGSAPSAFWPLRGLFAPGPLPLRRPLRAGPARCRPSGQPPGFSARPASPSLRCGLLPSVLPLQPRRPIRSAAGSRRLRSGCPCSAPGRLWASQGPPGPPLPGPSGLRGGSFLAGGQAAASGGSGGFAPRLFAAFGRCSQRALLRLGPTRWVLLNLPVTC